MKPSLLLLLLFLIIENSIAQVGINTQNPDPTSILDLMANDKGLLLPRLDSNQRKALTLAPPANSLLVFDTDVKAFFYFNSSTNTWLALNPLQSQMRNSADSIISKYKVRIENDLNVTGRISGNGAVPTGAILIWSGLSTAIPSGWILCDGSNGTPDLRERFIVGSGGDNPSVAGTLGYPVSSIGGFNQVTLTAAQSGLPSHTHGVNDPGHSHYMINNGNVQLGTSPSSVGTTYYDDTYRTSTENTGITLYSNTAQNAVSAHENRPPFYALCYIMKL
jgi:microcystin-dependent protein